MLGFMDYVQQAWAASTRWDADNSYVALTATSRALLDFATPTGLALHCSSLASRSFANSYSLANAGQVDGSLSYLYVSKPLVSPFADNVAADVNGTPAAAAAVATADHRLPSRSTDIPLRALIRGYKELSDLVEPEDKDAWEIWQGGRRVDRRDTLLYGRLYLPQSRLEALYMRRLSPTAQLKIACVSSRQLRNGGSLLLLLQRDQGKVSTEYLYSTDGGLVGLRGLYNFGPDPHEPSADTASGLQQLSSIFKEQGEGSETLLQPNGRFSAGAELYYGALNKTGGVSMGCRFATLPRHRGFPYTMTLTLNPLMGNLSSTYSVKAAPSLALATRFDFNVYSYESEYQVGFELWKKKREFDEAEGAEGIQWAVKRLRESERNGWISARVRDAAGKMIGGLEPEDAATLDPAPASEPAGASSVNGTAGLAGLMQPLKDEEVAGVLKGRMNQNGVLGILWEGRVKQLLYSFGLNVDFQQREQIFRGVGIEFHYSS